MVERAFVGADEHTVLLAANDGRIAQFCVDQADVYPQVTTELEGQRLGGAVPLGARIVLVAVAKGEGAEERLRGWFAAELPTHLRPSEVRWVDALPLSPNGKIDRKQLPPPTSERPELESAYVAPRTPLEGQLAEIWQEVLEVEQVGIEDNFFDLGGASIQTLEAASRAQEIGLRMAIGATGRDVLLMVLRQAAVLGLAGAVAGLAIAGVARPLIAGMLGDVQLSLLTIGVTACSLVAVVLLAAWFPARRAAQIQPTLALKEQ